MADVWRWRQRKHTQINMKPALAANVDTTTIEEKMTMMMMRIIKEQTNEMSIVHKIRSSFNLFLCVHQSTNQKTKLSTCDGIKSRKNNSQQPQQQNSSNDFMTF